MPGDTTHTDTLQPPAGWAGARTQRIPAPPPRERGLLFRTVSAFSGLLGRPDLPDIFPAMHVNARLFWPWLIFASQMMPFGRLPATERERIILRTAWHCRSRYEWGQHVEIGLKAGLTDADIVTVANGPAACADEKIRALLQASDDLCRDECIADATWQTLAAHYDAARRIEITLLVGHYRMIAGFLNSSGLVLEKPLEDCLQAFNKRVLSAETASH